MDGFRLAEFSSRDRLASSVPSSRQGKKQSQKLKSPRSSSSEFNSCLCEALSENKQHLAHQSSGVPMKSLLAQEMSKQKETNKRRSPSIIARLMGLDVLPPPPQSSSSSHRQQQHKSVENHQQGSRSSHDAHNKSLRRSSKGEQKFKDVFEVLDAKKAESSRNFHHHHHEGRVNANLTQAEMAFIRQKFMEAKRLSTDEKLRHSKEFNDALEALDSNKDLLLKFLQHPDSLFTKHLHDLQSIPHKPHYGQAPSLKSTNSHRHVDSLKTQKVDRDLVRSQSGSHSRHVSYDAFDLPIEDLRKRSELQPTKIVVLKPNFGEPRYAGRTFASPSSSSDEFRADRRLPCTSNHSRQKSNEDIRHSRQNSRDSGEIPKTMSRQRKASCGNGSAMSFETSGFRGYAGDESSSGSDSTASESELVPVTSRTRPAYNRKNYHRSLPSNSTTSSVTREAKRRLSERWKLTHKYEQEIEISRSGTLAEMLATSDREARPASFSGLNFEEGISKRSENTVEWSELPEPVGISSRDGWKGSWTRSYSKSKTIMNQESTCSYTIVLPKPKGLINQDGLVKGNSSHHGESFFSSKSTPAHSSYNSSPEINISPSLSKVVYMNNEIRKEKLSPSRARSSFSADANPDSEDGSASDDIKTAMSSEAPDLSTVTSLTDPDILRSTTEDVNHASVPEPQSCEGSKEGDQPSPVSVLEASFQDDVSSSSECFESVSADLQGLRMQLQLLKLESAAYNEGAMLVSSDEDTDEEESSTITDETMMITQELGVEDWKSLYLVDLLANSRISDSDHNTVMATTTPVDPSLFEDLEKKYSSVETSTRLERKFLFDQISIELNQILKQFSDPHPWFKSTRICPKWDTNRIQETLRDLVTRKEKKPRKDDVDEKGLQWLSLEDDIEFIGREIEEMLTDELIAELVW